MKVYLTFILYLYVIIVLAVIIPKQIKFMNNSRKTSTSMLVELEKNRINDYRNLYLDLSTIKNTIKETTQEIYVVETEKFDKYFYAYPLTPIITKSINQENQKGIYLSRKDFINSEFIKGTILKETEYFIVWKNY